MRHSTLRGTSFMLQRWHLTALGVAGCLMWSAGLYGRGLSDSSAESAQPSRPAGNQAKPNILVIMSDEHNAGVLGCYGNRIVRTPNLDRLASQGVTFDAAYTTSPLCVPARLSFTAGKYISRIGAWNNSCRLPSDEYPSIARIMNAAGYESFLAGKMHYDRNHRYGFTEIGPSSTNQNAMNGRGSRRPPDALAPPSTRPSERFRDFHTGERSSILTHDQKVTAGVTSFLAGRRPGDKPFFLLAGYLAPHFPLIVPEEYWQRYRGRVPMPELPTGHLDALPLNYKHLRAGFELIGVDVGTVQRGRELYYGLTDWFDEQVGRVLTALDAAGLRENTVIIYTTDHGENMGEHGLWWKNCMYEHAARIPLIISWPSRFAPGQRRSAACSMVDLVQTIAELGGASAPSDWNGTSMVRWLADDKADWKDLAVSEYYAHNIASGFVMLRQGKYKYVYHTPAGEGHPAERELYDLIADPGEFHNLAASPAQQDRIQRMHAQLIRELGEDPDLTERRCREDGAKGYANQ